MTGFSRLRRSLGAALAALTLASLAACGNDHPNSTFLHLTDFGRDIDFLWDRLLGWGTAVFVLVEAVLLYTIVRYRARPGAPAPAQTHGNTALELTWTILPAVILVFIAIPTVRIIFKTQAKAPESSLQVEVIGHQWWWEFRYPQYGVTTANELYLPTGRTVNFALKTKDVLHSFWIPNLGGKRDLISNRTNYMWFTADSVVSAAMNGQCAEYCGDSHANMKFKVFTVAPADFESWAAHQKRPAVFGVAPAAPVAAAVPVKRAARGSLKVAAPTDTAPTPVGYTFPADQIKPFFWPKTPIPAGLQEIPGAVLAQGDPARGKEIYSRSACIGCHIISGNPMSMGVIGPNLTHFGSRHTLAAGLFANDARHLALWIKNSRLMKPGVLMNTQGMNEMDPMMKMKVTTGGLTDAQIADIVAYLRALK